jgi:hypothetical protein
MQLLERDRDTIEYLAYTFDTMQVDGEDVDPPDTYQISAVPSGTRPTEDDWHAAPWNVGPLDPGMYDIRIRFTDTPEHPVRYVAQLKVY